MKYVLVIGDGMADNPVPELGGKTPLEYAKIPNLDALAGRGEVGAVTNCPKGLPPGSDTNAPNFVMPVTLPSRIEPTPNSI